MKYIDAEKLIAEIRKLCSESCISESDDYYETGERNPEWSDEDKKMLLSIINAFRNETVSTIGQEQWLKNLPERFNLQQKPTEWKPQPESLEALMYAIEGKWEAIKPTSYLSRRLEDLYDGLVNTFNVDESFIAHENDYVSKSAEWSEEDKDMLNSCISSIEEAKENRYAYKETDGDTSYDHEIDWLKSLRPQPHKEIYQATKHDLAIKFMNYLDENRPEGKMSLSNAECEDIDKAFKENDWNKIFRYIEKYGRRN